MNIRLKAVKEGGGNFRPLKLPAPDQHPLVSVLIVNYNHARYIGRAIESVLQQTYRMIEVIVCDDGSTDNSCQVIESSVKPNRRVRLISKPHGGAASALNAAYAESSGSIICILDGDDLFLPEKIQAVVDQFRQDPQAGLMLHAMTIVDQEGNELQQMPFLSRFETGWIAERVVKRGGRYRHMPASALSIRREAAELVFPIPEDRFRDLAGDFIFTTLPLFTKVGAVPRVLAQYTIHGAYLTVVFRINTEKPRWKMADVRQVLDGVNWQLEKLGSTDRMLDPNRNLTIAEQQFVICLLDGEPRLGLVHDFLVYCGLLLRDDMFRTIQKLAYVFIFGTAIALPLSRRQNWISRAFSPTLKLRMQKAVDSLKSFFQPRFRPDSLPGLEQSGSQRQ